MRRSVWILVVVAVIASGCAHKDDATTTTTVAATTSTSTTTTASTTTTVAGLGSRVLTLGLEAGRLDKYDANFTYTIDISATGTLAAAEDVNGLSTIVIYGRLWRLILAGPTEGTFEVVEDFRPDSGTRVFTSGGTTVTQELDEFDLASYGGILGSYVIDDTGMQSDALGGTPAFYSLNPSLSGPLLSFGPAYPADPVGVGDGWSSEASVPVVGDVAFDAAVASEDEIEGALAYGVDYTGTASDLPLDLTLEEAANLLAADASAAAQLSTLAELGGDVAMRVTRFGVDASYHLDPERGVFVDSSTGTTVALTMDLTGPEGSMSLTARMSVAVDMSLTESAEALGYEQTGVLDRMAPDPFDVAADPLFALRGYDFEQVDDLTPLQDFSDAVASTRQDIFTGYAFAWVITDADERILTITVANGGPYRGAPQLAEILADFWSDPTPTKVTVAGRTAYRATVNGVEWLIWNGDTHLFILIGPRQASADLMQAFMEQPPPYRWRAGDCFDFRDDVESGSPYSPFGEVGLVHCSAEHTFEVIYSEPMPEEADAPYPDDIADRSQEACAKAYSTYTGSVDELASLVALVHYLPDPSEWERGSRYLACGVYLVGAHGTETVSGRLEGRGPDYPLTLSVGLCMAEGYPVACSVPHDTEVIAALGYPADASDPLPPAQDRYDTGANMCNAALDDYDPSPGPFDLGVNAVFHSVGTWDEGERTFYCLAYAFGDDPGPVFIVGEFNGVWQDATGGGSA